MAITEYYVSAAGAGTNSGADAANALTWAQMITQINALGAGGGAGRRYNYAGTSARTTTNDNITVGGTVANPLIIRGCSSLSSITDGNQGRTSTNGPLITTNFGVLTYTSGRLNLTSYTVIENISISASSLNNYLLFVAFYALIHHCDLVISGTGGASARAIGLSDVGASAIDCDVSNTCTTAVAAITVAGSGTKIVGCRINCTNAVGIGYTAAYGAIVDNIIANSVTGISLTAGAGNSGSILVYHNTIYNCSAEGILFPNSASTTGIMIAMNNHIQDCGQSIDSAYAATANLSVWWAYNRTDNTSPDAGFADWQTASDYGNITTATALEYPGSGDYNLTAGTSAIGAGFPKYASMGALQKSASGGSALHLGSLGKTGIGAF